MAPLTTGKPAFNNILQRAAWGATPSHRHCQQIVQEGPDGTGRGSAPPLRLQETLRLCWMSSEDGPHPEEVFTPLQGLYHTRLALIA